MGRREDQHVRHATRVAVGLVDPLMCEKGIVCFHIVWGVSDDRGWGCKGEDDGRNRRFDGRLTELDIFF